MDRTYSIHPIPRFKIEDYPKSRMTWLMNFGETITMAWYVWLISGGDRRILVDAGARAEEFLARGENVVPIQSIEEGLARHGLTGADIETVILTHMHDDHFGLADALTNAEFIVQRKELEFALDPHPLFAGGYKLAKELAGHTRFTPVEGDCVLFEGIEAVFSPGHSPGGQSIVISTEGGKAVLPGFCCIAETFAPPENLRGAMTAVQPAIFLDGVQLYDSVRRVQAIADRVIPLHEASFVDQLTV